VSYKQQLKPRNNLENRLIYDEVKAYKNGAILRPTCTPVTAAISILGTLLALNL